jgi:hypothetical protein
VWNDSETKTGGYEGVEMSAMIHFAQSLFHSRGKKLTLIYSDLPGEIVAIVFPFQQEIKTFSSHTHCPLRSSSQVLVSC